MLYAIAFFLLAGTASAQDELVLLSPHWEGVRAEFGDAFRRMHRQETGREVELRWLDVGGASDILKFIRAEYNNKPGGIGVDLFFGGGTDPYEELKRLGHLAPYPLPDSLLADLAPSIGGVPLRDPDYAWYAATMAGFGIIYNKEVLRRLKLPEPRTWEDLADPALFSWVGSADPRKSGSVHMAYEIMLQAYGWERGWQIVTALGANVRGFSGYASQTPKDVTIGEVAYGLSIDSYAWHQVREAGEDMIGFCMPQDLTVVNGDGIAILRGAPHRDTAERFIRLVLSEEGQKLWLLRLGEKDGPQRFELGKFSVQPGLYAKVQGRTAVQVDPFAWRSDFRYDAAKGSARWGLVNDLIGTQLIESHAALKNAWRRPDANLAALSRPPLSEAEAMDLARSSAWSDPSTRNRTVGAWSAWARDKYAGASTSGFWQALPALATLVFAGCLLVYARRQNR